MTHDGERRWARPPGADDATVEAVGKLSEAVEWVERARGHLYEFHHLMGHADLMFDEAADLLRRAGHADTADELTETVIGRNVLEGRWTFQVVDEFDDTYWSFVRSFDQLARDQLMGGSRHVFESELKEQRRTDGLRHHESRPG